MFPLTDSSLLFIELLIIAFAFLGVFVLVGQFIGVVNIRCDPTFVRIAYCLESNQIELG
jgi:hypothetical protein